MAAVSEKASLTFVRSFKVEPQKVWRAWTDPALMQRWFGPSDAYTVLIAEADVRVGGRYHITMRPAGGGEHNVSGVYREVVPEHRLVFTWAWASTPERESLVTVELRPAGSGTELTLRHEQLFDEKARESHEQGWTGCIGRLERLLAA